MSMCRQHVPGIDDMGHDVMYTLRHEHEHAREQRKCVRPLLNIKCQGAFEWGSHLLHHYVCLFSTRTPRTRNPLPQLGWYCCRSTAQLILPECGKKPLKAVLVTAGELH